jgi:hypothetical protein
MKRIVLSTLVCTALAAAAPFALGQSAPAVDQGQRGAAHERAFRMPSERVEARLAYLKTALKITDAQAPQWNAFADALRQQARNMDERIEARRAERAQVKRDARPNAIERLERRQARLAAASARLNETLAAAKPLYAALNPEQQRVADELFAPHRRGGHGHHRGRG